ncbi:MAG TPA: hypothetical protein VF475_17230 [Sphingobium sp.]
MTFGRNSLLLMIAAHAALGTAAFAQRTDEQGYEIEEKGHAATARRHRDEAQAQSRGSDTYTVTTRRTYDGGYTTKDSDGYSVTSRRTYDGGFITKDNEGYSVSCRPTYNGRTCRRVAPRGQ